MGRVVAAGWSSAIVRATIDAKTPERSLCSSPWGTGQTAGVSFVSRADGTLKIVMDSIRILHHHEPGFGWSFESPDIPGLTGGGDAYDQAHAEDAARFALVCAAEDQDNPAPTDLIFEHYVPVGVPAAA